MTPETKLRNARKAQAAIEARRAEILAQVDERGRPVYGYGFIRSVTTAALRAGIEVTLCTSHLAFRKAVVAHAKAVFEGSRR